MKLDGKTFFITGGVSGLGEGVARLFVSKGANVIVRMMMYLINIKIDKNLEIANNILIYIVGRY